MEGYCSTVSKRRGKHVGIEEKSAVVFNREINQSTVVSNMVIMVVVVAILTGTLG